MITLHLAVAEARTLHVAMSGGDDNPGRPEAPLRTMQKAAEVARAGDTILVHAGVYRGHLLVRSSGEPGKPVIFKNAPGEKPVFDGEGRGRIELQSEQGWRKPVGWITVEGFEVRNGWDGINSDFHLRKGSPAIDSARVQSVVATDLDGTRPQGGARDVGAFEYHP